MLWTLHYWSAIYYYYDHGDDDDDDDDDDDGVDVLNSWRIILFQVELQFV